MFSNLFKKSGFGAKKKEEDSKMDSTASAAFERPQKQS